MARKLAITDKVLFPVQLVVNDAGTSRTFRFNLTAIRSDSETLKRQLADDNLPLQDFLVEKVTGWDGQRLVLEEDGTASPFSTEAFIDLLSVPGAPMRIFQDYLKAVQAKEKN